MTQFTFPGDIDSFTGDFLKNGDGIFIAEDGSVGIGTNDPVQPVDIVNESDLGDVGNVDVVSIWGTSEGTNDVEQRWYNGLGIYVINEALASGAGKNEIYGEYIYAGNNGDADILYGNITTVAQTVAKILNKAYGLMGWTGVRTGGTITEAYGLHFSLTASGSESTITTGYGIFIYSETVDGGSIGTMYGLFIGALAGTTKWAIYVSDTAPNYLAGNLGLGVTEPTAKLDVNSDVLRLRTAKTPASASASGNAGDVCWDANYFYVCVATNTWKRTPLSTW
jgi:hypothetical protein